MKKIFIFLLPLGLFALENVQEGYAIACKIGARENRAFIGKDLIKIQTHCEQCLKTMPPNVGETKENMEKMNEICVALYREDMKF